MQRAVDEALIRISAAASILAVDVQGRESRTAILQSRKLEKDRMVTWGRVDEMRPNVTLEPLGAYKDVMRRARHEMLEQLDE